MMKIIHTLILACITKDLHIAIFYRKVNYKNHIKIYIVKNLSLRYDNSLAFFSIAFLRKFS